MECGPFFELVAPDDAEGVELLLEPTGHPATVALQQALYKDGIPLAQLYTEDNAAEFARRTRAMQISDLAEWVRGPDEPSGGIPGLR